MERYWELDFLRGVSVVLMIVFNWSYALEFLDIAILVPKSNYLYWQIFPLVVASSFMLIAGISLTLSLNKLKQKSDNWKRERFKKYPIRGIKIFSLGLIITIITWIFFPENFIFFGILHLIGASILLSAPLISSKGKSLAASIAILIVYLFSSGITSSRVIASLGIDSFILQTMDYFPVVPWMAVVFLGISLGHIIFPEGKRRLNPPAVENKYLAELKELGALLGRNSLKIYLLHQPILILALALLGYPVLQ